MSRKPEAEEVRNMTDIVALAQAMYEADVDILEKYANRDPDQVFSAITLMTLMLLYSASGVFSVDKEEVVRQFCSNLGMAAEMKNDLLLSMSNTMH